MHCGRLIPGVCKAYATVNVTTDVFMAIYILGLLHHSVSPVPSRLDSNVGLLKQGEVAGPDELFHFFQNA